MAERLSNEALEARRAYLREWRRKNKDKVKSYNARYWERVGSKTIVEEKKTVEEKKVEEPVIPPHRLMTERTAIKVGSVSPKDFERFQPYADMIFVSEEGKEIYNALMEVNKSNGTKPLKLSKVARRYYTDVIKNVVAFEWQTSSITDEIIQRAETWRAWARIKEIQAILDDDMPKEQAIPLMNEIMSLRKKIDDVDRKQL